MRKEAPAHFPLRWNKKVTRILNVVLVRALGSILPVENKPGSGSLHRIIGRAPSIPQSHTTGERQNHQERRTLESDTVSLNKPQKKQVVYPCIAYPSTSNILYSFKNNNNRNADYIFRGCAI